MAQLNEQILTMLNKSEGHLTAEEAFIMAKNKNMRVSFASIYRVLGKLSEEGKIKRLLIPGHPDVFDKTTYDHVHMVCEKCGKVKDVDSKKIKDVLSGCIDEKFDSYNLTLNYICKDCKKKGAA